MDLIRTLLLEIEKLPQNEYLTHGKFSINSYSDEEVTYNLKLLNEKGLIKANFKSESAFLVKSDGLTWEGHEFLDATRDETRWKKVKKTVSEKGGSLPFDVIKALAIQIAREAVGLG